jgi:hypothetical protein
MRAKLRRDNEDPKVAQSSTDSENTDPRRDNPSTEHAEPIRLKLLIDRDEPMYE